MTSLWCHRDDVRVVSVVVGLVAVFCGGCGRAEEDRSGVRKPPSQWKVSDLDIVLSEPTETWEGPRSPQGGDSNNSESLEGARETHSPLARLVID